MLRESECEYIQMEGEDGETFTLGAIGIFEYEGCDYAAFYPADLDEDDPDYGVIIMRVKEKLGDNEYLYEEIVDEELQDKVYDQFVTEFEETYPE